MPGDTEDSPRGTDAPPSVTGPDAGAAFPAAPAFGADDRLGQRVPDFLLVAPDGTHSGFYERHCGRPAVLLLAPDAESCSELVAGLEPASVLCLLAAAAFEPGRWTFPCIPEAGELAETLGETLPPPGAAPLALVLDASLRLVERIFGPAPEQLARSLAGLAAAPPAPLTAVAPVLMLPGVLEPALCAKLIAAFESDHFESGMPRNVGDELRLLPDPAAKRRHDHLLRDEALVAAVTDRIVERVLPDVVAAFHHEVTHLEGFKVARYDADVRGFFRAHRDNTTPDARHRRFALTLNLNGGYEGGALAFPEFGPQRYHPAAGGALVFSGSLLHEAGEVTAGRRYVLLTFMWGES